MPEDFDVFLSHNSRDKPLVEQIGERLRARGLRVWLDKWELRPGFPWQEGLEEAIQASRAVAVFVGNAGLGSWQEPEMRAFITRSRREKVPVIPVLLPGCPESPQLTLFLEAFTWVDLRGGLTENGLARLVWGITGEKPEGTRETAVPRGRKPRPWRTWAAGLALLVMALTLGAWLRLRSPAKPEVPLQQPEAWIRGRVVDGDNRPLAGVQISRQSNVPGTATTDADGRFELRLSEPPGPRVGLRVERAGSSPEDEFCYSGTQSCIITLGER